MQSSCQLNCHNDARIGGVSEDVVSKADDETAAVSLDDLAVDKRIGHELVRAGHDVVGVSTAIGLEAIKAKNDGLGEALDALGEDLQRQIVRELLLHRRVAAACAT